MDKNIAILELIEKCFFDALLVIDVPRDLKELLQLRSDNLYSLESVKIDNFEIINKKFDLIVSFSAHSKVIDILTEVYNKDSCEILIVCLESGSFNLKKFTYNPKSSELLKLQKARQKQKPTTKSQQILYSYLLCLLLGLKIMTDFVKILQLV